MDKLVSRRHLLALGTGMGAGLLGNTVLGARGLQGSSNASVFWSAIEGILQAQGMFQNGVFSIEIDRNDISDVTIRGVPIKPSFEVNGTIYFQRISDDDVMMNGDFPLKTDEVQPFISHLVGHQIVFQAQHQHFYDFEPPIWFIHFRQRGSGTAIAEGLKSALDVTSTPFPQTLPSNPTTPLPAKAIGKILGASPNIGSDGVVNFDVPREDPVYLNEHARQSLSQRADQYLLRTAGWRK